MFTFFLLQRETQFFLPSVACYYPFTEIHFGELVPKDMLIFHSHCNVVDLLSIVCSGVCSYAGLLAFETRGDLERCLTTAAGVLFLVYPAISAANTTLIVTFSYYISVLLEGMNNVCMRWELEMVCLILLHM